MGQMWFKLEYFIRKNKVWTTTIDKKPGVYLLRCVKDNEPIKVGRFRKIDSKGIMYIGSAKNLKERIYNLIHGVLKGKGDVHTAVKTLIFTSLIKDVEPKNLEVAWITCENEKEAREQETVALKHYADNYGEPPPLNLQIRREMLAIVGLMKIGKSISPKLKDELKELLDP